MPRRKTSLKQQRKDKKKHRRNLKVKRELKKTLKKFHELISTKKLDEAKAFLQKVFSQLDKAAKKHVIHTRIADRRKSRLSRKVKAG